MMRDKVTSISFRAAMRSDKCARQSVRIPREREREREGGGSVPQMHFRFSN